MPISINQRQLLSLFLFFKEYVFLLLGQQISAAVVFAWCRNDFILLVSFYSILYHLKPVLSKMQTSDIKVFPLFLLFCQFNKHHSEHSFSFQNYVLCKWVMGKRKCPWVGPSQHLGINGSQPWLLIKIPGGGAAHAQASLGKGPGTEISISGLLSPLLFYLPPCF